MIGTNGTDVCFRTGNPSELSPIYSADIVANTLRDVGGGFPRALTFKGETSSWADEASRTILQAAHDGPEAALSIGPSYMVSGLNRLDRNLFWNQIDPSYSEPKFDRIRVSRADGSIAVVARVDGFVSAFAAALDDVFIVDHEHHYILRAPRPY